MNKGKQVFTASILAAVLVVSIAVLSVPEAEGLHPIDIVGAIGPGELALDLLVPLDFNVALETDGAGEIVSSAVTDTELNLLDGQVATLVNTGAASTYGDFEQIFRDGRLIVRDADNSNSYIISGAESTSDRVITIPAPIGSDVFVLQAHAQALSGKTITSVQNTLTIDCDVSACSGIDNGDIDGDAVIAFSKLATLATGNILIGDGAGDATSVDPTGIGDIEAKTTTGLTIKANIVDGTELADTITLDALTTIDTTAAGLRIEKGNTGATIFQILFGNTVIAAEGLVDVTVTGAGTGGDIFFCSVTLDTNDDWEIIALGEMDVTGTITVEVNDKEGDGIESGGSPDGSVVCIVFDRTT